MKQKKENLIRKNESESTAAIRLGSSLEASRTISSYLGLGVDLELYNELKKQTALLKQGDLSKVEEMLFNQAHVLQVIFSELSCRAIDSKYMPNLEGHLRLALKAQAQCVRTIEALGNLKNPAPVAFVRQANIGQSVQVNNEISLPPNTNPSFANIQKSLNPSNELLEVQYVERLDPGAASSTITDNSQLEPIKQVNRTKNGNREKTLKPKRL